MFSTAYLTTPLKGQSIEVEVKALQAEIALNGYGAQLIDLDEVDRQDQHHGGLDVPTNRAIVNEYSEDLYQARLLIDGHANIPIYAHPVDVIMDHGTWKRVVTVCDARGLAKRDQSGKIRVNAYADFKFQQTRALLSSKWLELIDIKETRASIYDFGVLVFSRWVAETIATRYGCDVDAQLRIQILAAHHMVSMHAPHDTPVDAATETMLLMKIHSITRLPSDAILSVLDGLGYNEDIHAFVENVRAKSNSSILADFDLAALYTVLRGRWFGKSANEVVAVSLEHPPTWYAMVYSSLMVASYEGTSVGKIAKQEAKNHTAEAMLKVITIGLRKGYL